MTATDSYHTDIFVENGQPYLLLGKVAEEQYLTSRVDIGYYAVQEGSLTIFASEPSLDNVYLQVNNDGATSEVSMLSLYPKRIDDPHRYLTTIILLLVAVLLLMGGFAAYRYWMKREEADPGEKESTSMTEFDRLKPEPENEAVSPVRSKKLK